MAKYTLESEDFKVPVAVEATQFADLVTENKRLTAERSELISALEFIVEALEFRIAVGPQGARERAERVLASVSGR